MSFGAESDPLGWKRSLLRKRRAPKPEKRLGMLRLIMVPKVNRLGEPGAVEVGDGSHPQAGIYYHIVMVLASSPNWGVVTIATAPLQSYPPLRAKVKGGIQGIVSSFWNRFLYVPGKGLALSGKIKWGTDPGCHGQVVDGSGGCESGHPRGLGTPASLRVNRPCGLGIHWGLIPDLTQ
ncbi:hypothetical protein J6590_018969 [Homalodisca vitripennis]|nr:hypothetical protein J6590_018969 [Homalodisca vitripennis]